MSKLQLNAAHRRGAGYGAEACVLRQLASRGEAAVSVVLAVLDRHRRRGVEGYRRVPGVELHNVQDVEDIRSELEPAGLLELPEAERPNDPRVPVIEGSAADVHAGR